MIFNKPAQKFHAYFEVVYYCWEVFNRVGIVKISPDVFIVCFAVSNVVGVVVVDKCSVDVKVWIEPISVESYSKW